MAKRAPGCAAVALLLVAASLVGCGSNAEARCGLGQLEIVANVTGNGSAGTAGSVLVVENDGRRPCGLSNHLVLSGRRVNVTAGASLDLTDVRQNLNVFIAPQNPALLSVPPGARATLVTTYGLPSAQAASASPCTPSVNFRALTATIDGTGTVTAPPDAVFYDCDVVVHPWRAGMLAHPFGT